MTATTRTQAKPTTLLALVFFFSGFSTLIYQVAWQRLLSLHYGVGAVSITLIVSIYMFGLGLGALLGGLLAERFENRICLYSLIELLIGCFGLVSIWFLDYLARLSAGAGYVFSLLYMSLFLCLPTLLMGTTLPLLTKIFNRLVHNFFRTVSVLYFVNTIGAALGTLFAGYVLISLFGLDTAVYFAAAVNFILAAVIFSLSRVPLGGQNRPSSPGPRPSAIENRQILGRVAYAIVFVTGFLAIGYEIIWLRVISVLVKASPYAFSSVLSVYLFGIAIGSFWMGRSLRKRKLKADGNFFFLLQFLIAAGVMVTFAGYYYLTRYTFLSYYTQVSFACPVHPPLISTGSVLTDLHCSLDIFAWPVLFVLVPTILMGAGFPLISSLALSRRDKEGSTIASVYFFNVTGNILGGIVTGFVLLPALGTEPTVTIFVSVGILFGLAVTRMGGRKLPAAERIALVAAMLLTAVIFLPRKGRLYETMHTRPAEQFNTYIEEGKQGIVVTYRYGGMVVNYINGLAHGMRPQPLFNYETIEAASFAPKVENVLIIGFGTGAVTETVLKLGDVKKVTLVEISGALIKNLRKIPEIDGILSDTRIETVIDDGRRYLLVTPKRFDLILTDPLRATTAYSNNLYSRDFYELAKGRLNLGGVIMVGIYEHSDTLNRIMYRTLLSAFTHIRAYRFFCLASDEPLERNSERQNRLLASFGPGMRKMLSSGALLDFSEVPPRPDASPKPQQIYLGDEKYIEKLTDGYPINRDNKPVCEYYIGLLIRKLLRGGR